MKFNRNLDWLKESDEDDILGDELDDIKGDEEQINEVRYIDPSNVDKYDPSEIEEVTTASGEKRYKRKTGAQPSNQTVDKKEEPSTKSANNNNTNIVNLPKEVSTSQLNDILYKDLGIQKKELAKNNKLTEQDLSKVKETLDNGNSIMAHLEFWDDRGYLIELVSIYQKGKDDKIYRSAYQNYSGTWVRDEEDDAEYTYTTDEFTSDVLDSLAEDTKCKLTY